MRSASSQSWPEQRGGVDETAFELRRQAEHCRELAMRQYDERLRIILNDAAAEFDRRAANMEEIRSQLPDQE